MNKSITPNPANASMKAFITACETLEIGFTERAKLLGVNKSALTNNTHRGFSKESKMWELQLHFMRLYHSLYVVAGGNNEFMAHWFHTYNNALNGVPAALCLSVEGLLRVNQYLDAMQTKD